MTFTYKEYKDKRKVVQEQWLQLNKVFIGVLLENCYLVGKMNVWWGGGTKFGKEDVHRGENFFWWGGIANFRLLRGFSPVAKTLLSFT